MHADTSSSTNGKDESASLYAVGDVVGRVPLTPVAIAARPTNAVRSPLRWARPMQSSTTKTSRRWCSLRPPIGTVGLSEEAARARHGDASVRIYQTRSTDMYSGLLERQPPTVMKLVTVLSTRRCRRHPSHRGRERGRRSFKASPWPYAWAQPRPTWIARSRSTRPRPKRVRHPALARAPRPLRARDVRSPDAPLTCFASVSLTDPARLPVAHERPLPLAPGPGHGTRTDCRRGSSIRAGSVGTAFSRAEVKAAAIARQTMSPFCPGRTLADCPSSAPPNGAATSANCWPRVSHPSRSRTSWSGAPGETCPAAQAATRAIESRSVRTARCWCTRCDLRPAPRDLTSSDLASSGLKTRRRPKTQRLMPRPRPQSRTSTMLDSTPKLAAEDDDR